MKKFIFAAVAALPIAAAAITFAPLAHADPEVPLVITGRG